MLISIRPFASWFSIFSDYSTKASTFPHAPIYGGSNQVKSVTSIVKDKDELAVTDNITAKFVQYSLPDLTDFDHIFSQMSRNSLPYSGLDMLLRHRCIDSISSRSSLHWWHALSGWLWSLLWRYWWTDARCSFIPWHTSRFHYCLQWPWIYKG